MDETTLRADMIERLEHRLDRPLDERVLTALQRVPRETFVSESPYDDRAGREHGTRTLAPSTVVRMIAALDPSPDEETLVVGAGVGYTAAVLAEIVGARHVHAIDIDREIVHVARSNLSAAGYDAVLVDRRNGSTGLPEYAPFDRILLEAAVADPPRALIEQLDPDGRLVFPNGTGEQTLLAVEPEAGGGVDAGGVDRSDRPASPTSPSAGRRGGYRVRERAGPVRLQPMLADGERGPIERNRTRREDAERAVTNAASRQGWEQDWVDWDDLR
ncbi:protein-L-isoaspartate(D-aspartate) O-methyltransferase [Halopenitus malekzadehii]|uniref:protein-L-isoaspartate(D-aspartate) O-methyltransferase n=1 Tax=Halopenitus malekzadehii TaxID=1267564 RepID=A0A1H6HRY6_9EURY|nr:protein-L-isoaspartate O-methyltransferase [Halopenitus malekzadehii]SEH36733.1 protein-L-isoaspartate(D-aspartate) O-methyltransferase [Halopenitus malekzadehii]